jgi:alpha-L-arabinofuranosidase
MINNLQVCMNKCNSIIQSINIKQQAELRALAMKHMTGIQAKYMSEIFKLYTKKDIVGIIKIIRIIINEKEFKEKFILLLDDVTKLYQKNKENINKITTCFLSHCNKEALDFLHEVCGLIYDLFKVLDDKIVNKKMEIIQKHFYENIKYAEVLLQPKKKQDKKPKKVKKV